MKILTMRRILICTCIVACISTISSLLLYLRSYISGRDSTKIKGMLFILQWTSPHTSPFNFWGHGQQEFIKRKCKVNYCYVTADRSFFPNVTQFDAIAFHGPEIQRYYIPNPRVRSPRQKYVFVIAESSHNYPICNKRYEGFFNWTWTYRLDSDVPYGYVTVRNATGHIIGPNEVMHWIKLDSMQPIDQEMKVLLGNKTKAAAWFVSNCNSLSKRDEFVIELQDELNKYGLGIDVFSDCFDRWTPKYCPKTIMNKCLKIIQEEYYFYLSLENSFSQDYVTEKLLIALNNYAVPVVFGGANYTRFVPDGIYLHGGKLKSPDLAKEMNDIINDKERYYSFFKWRNHYSYHQQDEAPDSDELCKMCEVLHNQTLVKRESVYKDFEKWWNEPEACSSIGTRHFKNITRRFIICIILLYIVFV